MRLRALQLQNFRQHADSVIEFGDGITGIIGPNGAGKTTILEAIAWALYGMDAARGKRDTIKFQRAAPRARERPEDHAEVRGRLYHMNVGCTPRRSHARTAASAARSRCNNKFQQKTAPPDYYT